MAEEAGEQVWEVREMGEWHQLASLYTSPGSRCLRLPAPFRHTPDFVSKLTHLVS